jgi:hypothetical protein
MEMRIAFVDVNSHVYDLQTYRKFSNILRIHSAKAAIAYANTFQLELLFTIQSRILS